MRKIFILIIIVSKLLIAQDPSDVAWKRIQTRHYQIIFPEEMIQEANRVANRMEFLYDKLDYHLEPGHDPISMILSNRSVISNGYVSAVPWRTEWYAMPKPGKSLNVGDWYTLLALHENRHIFQYSFLNRGWIRFFGYLFGSYGRAVTMNLMVPGWFMEGDAILSETLFSQSGRGRSAAFQKGYRAILLNNKHYKYEKARFGSYKDHTPDDYLLGYFMTAHIAREEGYSTWHNILKKATRFSFKHPFSPMSAGIDKYTEYKNTKRLFYGTQRDLQNIWNQQDEAINPSKISELTSADKKYYTNDTHGQLTADGRILFIRSGYADQTALYTGRNGNYTKLLKIPDTAREFGITVSDSLVAWSQYVEDKRWHKESFADIALYNLSTNQLTMLTERSRYLCPALSNSQRWIAVTEFTPERKCYLVLLNSESGEITKKFPTPNKEMLHYPAWSPQDNRLVFTLSGFLGRAIYEFNLNTEEFTQLTDYSHEDIFRPVYWRNFILYESNYSGIDNIYGLDRHSGEKFQVVSSRYGANFPAIKGDTLLFSNYTTNGFQLAKTNLDISRFTPLDSVVITRTDYFTPLMTEDFQPIEEKNITQKKYAVSDYRGLGKYLNIHSYSLLATEEAIGGILFSDNILGTLSQSAYFLKDYEGDEYDYGLNINYLELYPKINLNLNIAHRFNSYNGMWNSNKVGENWQELTVNLFTEWPLLRQDIGTTTNLSSLTIGTGVKKIFHRSDNLPAGMETTIREGMTYPFYFSAHGLSTREKARQDLGSTYSELSFFNNISISDLATTGTLLGWQFSQGFNLGNMHGLIFDLMSEEIEDKGYRFDETFTQLPVYSTPWSPKITKLRATFKQHLWFPDIDFFWFLYVKRFYVSLLYEQFGDELFDFEHQQQALGLGLTTEIGGFATIRANLKLTLFYYYNPETSADGMRVYFEF